MAQWGVSVFLGTAGVAEKLPAYIAAVARLKGTQVFTSLHIPEVPLANALAQLTDFTRLANEHGLGVGADIAPGALKQMGATPDDLAPLQAMGLAGVRLDYGFAPSEIARFTRAPQGLRVVLNTSTVDPVFLGEIMRAGADPDLLEGCHNYYPRPETGISLDRFLATSAIFKQHGLKNAAFVAGKNERRGPIFAGLPTLEKHRDVNAGQAAAELLATGLVDAVLFGDPFASDAELEQVSAAAAAWEGTIPSIPLRVRLTDGISEVERHVIVGGEHENRPDCAEYVIRSTASRAYAAQGPAIQPHNTVERPRGAVTIDNVGYLRYSGELQIATRDLAADDRVNVVGHVIAADLPLLDKIGPSSRFTLIPV